MSDSTALKHLRICDFTGQLAGAGATKFLAFFGAQVIRIEDPTNEGRWDILRGGQPFIDERRGINLGGSFNNHNVEKLGITLNLRMKRGKELLHELIAISDVVSENFAAGVFERLGLSYQELREIRDDIIYVSNCGFGHSGPYEHYKTWGPVVQAVSGLTFSSGLPDQQSAGWGYSYMDHTGAYYMAMAILMALHHRNRTGDGQWVDMACTETGASLNGPALLDYTVNGRPLRRPGSPNSNRNQFPPMAPHGIYATEGEDNWIGISVRNESDWAGLVDVAARDWGGDARFATMSDRLANEDALDVAIEEWTRGEERFALSGRLQARGVPATPVQRPGERVDEDPDTSAWGLWPTVKHSEMGDVRVDGLPVHLSGTEWHVERGAPCLGEDNDYVFGELLGVSADELVSLREEGVL
ncbi:MAG: CoA transferase [Dehalococcoidia bacterium]|jgi:benzylsuccinate CoA-transferase BbsF subunit|nr:CoA transferase [Dehalococcoidia bacterium]